MEIRLIRHFATEGNLEKRYIGVTDEEIKAECVLEHTLKKEENGREEWKPELVIVSPLRRCRQTAEILFPGAEQVVCEQMRECDFGLFEGKNYQELTGNPKYQSWIDSGGTKAFPGGEDPMEFRKRCVCGFEQMMEKMIKGKRKKIAFVVHGGTIMSVMEAFDPEKKEFYHWQVKNGKGFHFQIEEEKWQQGDSLRRLRKYEFFDGMYSRNGAGCDFRGSGMALPPGTDHWKLDFDTGKVAARIL